MLTNAIVQMRHDGPAELVCEDDHFEIHKLRPVECAKNEEPVGAAYMNDSG